MQYGMGLGSYCLTRLPNYWDVRDETEVTTSIEGGNLTYLTDWEVTLEDASEERLYLTYRDDSDVWPNWSNDF